MTIKPVEPLERWTLGFDGMARRVLMSDLALGPLGGGPVTRLEVDLTCDATSPGWGRGMRTDTTTMNSDDKNPAISGSGLHLEQSIKVTGTVKFDDYEGYTHQNKHQMLVQQIQNGVHHTVFPANIADAKPQYPTPAWDQR